MAIEPEKTLPIEEPPLPPLLQSLSDAIRNDPGFKQSVVDAIHIDLGIGPDTTILAVGRACPKSTDLVKLFEIGRRATPLNPGRGSGSLGLARVEFNACSLLHALYPNDEDYCRAESEIFLALMKAKGGEEVKLEMVPVEDILKEEGEDVPRTRGASAASES